MFSKTKEVDQSQAQAAKRNMKSAPSIISADMTVTGSVDAAGEIQIDGKVEGDIQTGSLTIGEKATVHGEIVCDEVIVRGRVIGSLRANRVQLSSTSHVEGDILHSALAVETGAFFEGNCRHSDNPLSESLPNAKSAKGADLTGLQTLDAEGAKASAVSTGKPSFGGDAKKGKQKVPVEAQSALKKLTEASHRR